MSVIVQDSMLVHEQDFDGEHVNDESCPCKPSLGLVVDPERREEAHLEQLDG